MDIDKTIKYFERIARANKSANLDERAEEYTQIAEWLKELKELKQLIIERKKSMYLMEYLTKSIQIILFLKNQLNLL